MWTMQISANRFGNEILKKGLHLMIKLMGKRLKKDNLANKNKGLQPNFISVYKCFCWKFAQKVRFRGFDVFSLKI